ncbi:YheC/YheD family protein [Cohnella cellulosilytica]|uniref:YheC/YheD family protein n=1 Tax=Cohnella cellulosilytica TaxID=986710 RepID=A0ABW2FEM4_9BACL
MNRKTKVTSKWIKTKLLKGSSVLARHIPATRRLTAASLRRMLGRHGMVYIKPVSGSCGVGVMRIDRASGRWTVRDGVKRQVFRSYSALYGWVRTRIGRKPYLVQRGIHMLRLGGRPIDYRVMIQKGRKAGWKVTGVAARVASPRKAVTNGSQGGSIHEARGLLRRTAGKKRAAGLLTQFDRLAYATARRFGRAYPRMRELGLDIAVDRRKRAWIIEVNTRPDPCPFTKLADQAMLRRIVRYARGYGRSYVLRCMKARRG